MNFLIILVFACQMAYALDGKMVNAEDLPAIVGLRVTPLTGTTLLLSVVRLHIELELRLLSGELSIRAPHALYAGKFTGICGKFAGGGEV